jgi:PQQ-dependent catabolism-associated CXXCW motif protein
VRLAFLVAALLLALPAAGQFVVQARGWPQVDETEDFGVSPSAELRLEDHATPTPLAIPGARLIVTAELQKLMQRPRGKRPLLFDVTGADRHLTVYGANWLPGAGRGSSFDDEVQARLARTLELATEGNGARGLVFFCASPRCWLSYNAALRAVRLGYSNVQWYRGGVAKWGVAGGDLMEAQKPWPFAP